MKLRVSLIAGCTVLNAVLIAAFVRQPSLAPGSLGEYLRKQRPDASDVRDVDRSAKEIARAAEAAASPAELWPALYSSDLRTLVQRLRDAGFPPAMLRAIVDAEVERQFSPRFKELAHAAADTPYWRQDPGYYSTNPKVFEAINQLYRERSRVLRDLLGQDSYALPGHDPSEAQRRQFGNLSPAKIDLVQRITDDYAEMSGQVRAAMEGVTLPEDREKLALLEREKRADLAAILTPEELADYEMRTSPITMHMRTAFSIMDASEAEFRAIYRAQEPYKDLLYPTSPGGMSLMTSEIMETRRAASRAINEQIEAALGPDRFASYRRAADSDFQQLYRLGQRDGVPYETLVRTHDARTPIAEASMKIVDDRTSSAEQKRAALKELAQQARTTVLSTLGPSAGPAYAASARWLMYLEQGRGFSIGPDGSISSRSYPMPPRPSTATPAR